MANAKLEWAVIEGVNKYPSIALETLKGQISWLEYVPDYDMTEKERERVCTAARKLFEKIRPLTEKYID